MIDISRESKGSLLLVDDELNIINSLTRIFEPLHYDVYTASNGLEALSVLENNEIHIIISDMRMPEMDGAALLKQAAERWPDVHRVLLTGYADINSAIAAVNDGHIDYYLHKPWQPNELEKTIHSIMEKRELVEKNKLLQAQLATKNKELLFLNNNLEDIAKERTVKLEHAYKEIEQGYSSVIQILSSLCEQQKSSPKGYLQSVARLSQLLAERLGLSAKEVKAIHTAGLLHTLGKIGLPESVNNTAYKKLSSQELVQFETYPLLGGAILSGYPALEEVAALITAHRELMDGKGYPNQLKGNTIPFGARILSIVVDYHELQLGLLLPETLVANQAIQFIKEDSNQRYDKGISEFFIHIIDSLPHDKQQLSEYILPPDALKPGMILTRDVYTDNGLKLLSKGYVLTNKTIATISAVDSLVVHVNVESATGQGH